jgi:hypothetical protein
VTTTWKSIRNLKDAFNDAVNYRTRAEKELFNKLFLRTEELQRCLDSSTYYLLGEKGAGKTAYAVYLENNSVDRNKARVATLTETQYRRFVELKNQHKLIYSDYAAIWRSTLMFIVAQAIVEKSKGLLSTLTGKFKTIEREIERWNKSALNPEIEAALEFVNSQSVSAKILKKDLAEVGGDQRKQETEKQTAIRHHLLETERGLKEAVADLTLADNHILFVDGIDFRPESISYSDYIECIKGLGEAAWQLNTEFFGSIRDSRGRIKIVLLLRPDIFHKLNLYNSNSRIQDNCVYLKWSTTEKEYRSSNLFIATARYLSSQQWDKMDPQEAWDHYFGSEADSNFKELLRITFQKPRDMLTFLKIARKIEIERTAGSGDAFSGGIIREPAFTREFSDYLLGEVRNYAAFYMTPIDFSHYLKFFQYLRGKGTFDFSEFSRAYEKFKEWSTGEEIRARDFLRDAEALLQFMYDVNIIGYKERTTETGNSFHHWSYRERTLNTLNPKVKAEALLVLNPGIAKALDIGKVFTEQEKDRSLAPREKPRRRGGRRRSKTRAKTPA